MGYYINVEPNVNLYVEDLNPECEKTFVFLHGWPGSHKLFEYQYDQLTAKGYRCIGIDQRGFGKSDKPVGGNNYDRLSDDIRCLMEVLDLKDVTLVGHSTGGAIAIRYMARHQAHGVSKLVLCAAAAPSLIKRSYFPYGLDREVVLDIIKETLNNRPKMLKNFSDTFFFQNVGNAITEWFFQLGLEAAGWSTAAIANAWLDEEGLFYDLGKIHTPTLIMHGIHDSVCLFPLAEAQRTGISNSILIPFENSGHALFYEERDKFNRELMKFMESNR